MLTPYMSTDPGYNSMWQLHGKWVMCGMFLLACLWGENYSCKRRINPFILLSAFTICPFLLQPQI